MSEQRKTYADLKDELLITRDQIAKRVKEMGFDRAFPPNTPPETTIQALREILHMEDEIA